MIRLLVLCLTFVVLISAPASVSAKAQTVKLKTTGPTIPQAGPLVVMIRSVLIALNNANLTGNYTVIRALGSSDFQSANSSAKLAALFTPLRNRNLDLGPALLYQPKLIKQPAITGRGFLRLTGYFQTRPEQVNFDFGFKLENGRWRLFAIMVNVAKVTPAVAKNKDRKGNSKKKRIAKQTTKATKGLKSKVVASPPQKTQKTIKTSARKTGNPPLFSGGHW